MTGGYAIIKYEYDPYGRLQSETYLDTEENLVISSEYHCAGMNFAYNDGYGNRTGREYFGTDSRIMVRDDLGYAGVLLEYNPFGEVVSEEYYGADKKTAKWKGRGYGYYEQVYDRGKETERRYFDVKGGNQPGFRLCQI